MPRPGPTRRRGVRLWTTGSVSHGAWQVAAMMTPDDVATLHAWLTLALEHGDLETAAASLSAS
jgi:hypothetical protein